MSIERLILRTLLVVLDRHDLDALAQDRSQLGICELGHVTTIIVMMLDALNDLALKAICDLLKRPVCVPKTISEFIE
jgi:hypothetical protein